MRLFNDILDVNHGVLQTPNNGESSSIFSADKGRTTVFWDTGKFTKKPSKLWNSDITYRMLENDQNMKPERKTNSVLKKLCEMGKSVKECRWQMETEVAHYRRYIMMVFPLDPVHHCLRLQCTTLLENYR